MSEVLSIAIETSCRAGAVALGRGDALLATRALGATGRHAADLLPAIQTLLAEHQATAADVAELYVSVGPGSFTGLRVGLTAARTWAQIQPSLRLVAVPTPLAVAQATPTEAEHVAVLLAAKEHTVHATLWDRSADGTWAARGESCLGDPADLLADWPRPIVLTGEALGFLEVAWPEGVTLVAKDHWMPAIEHVWRVGRQMAAREEYMDPAHLLPVYARRPEAIRLWEKRHGVEIDP